MPSFPRVLDRAEALMARPIIVEELDSWADPELVFSSLFGSSEYAYWLDSGSGADDGWSYMGDLSAEGFVAIDLGDAGACCIHRPATGETQWVDRSIADVVGMVGRGERASTPVGALGWVGWLGYETAARDAGMVTAGAHGINSGMLLSAWQLAFDHRRRRIHLVYFSVDDRVIVARHERAIRMIRELSGVRPNDPPRAGDVRQVTSRHSRSEYLDLIRRCQESITDGDAYQVCLTNRFESRTDENALTVYRRLRRTNPARYGAYLRVGTTHVLSSSPELFLDVAPDGIVHTRPIKGTRPRGRDEVEDALQHDALLGDPKERAENVMIVDLMRNDLAAVAETGSVTVPSLFAVEAHPNLFQLVSTVSGELSRQVSAADVLRSTFPAGSMTGAPKRAAVARLVELEGASRGAYGGALGYFTADGRVRLSMTIRTMVFDGQVVLIGAGGGITALSVPEREWEEVLLKAQPLFAALGARFTDVSRSFATTDAAR